MKTQHLLFSAVLFTSLLTGCGGNESINNAGTEVIESAENSEEITTNSQISANDNRSEEYKKVEGFFNSLLIYQEGEATILEQITLEKSIESTGVQPECGQTEVSKRTSEITGYESKVCVWAVDDEVMGAIMFTVFDDSDQFFFSKAYGKDELADYPIVFIGSDDN